MLTKPRFSQHGYLKAVEPDTLFFFAASGTLQFQGPLYYRLANLVNGSHSINQIAALLKQDFQPMEVLAAFNTLQKAGVIEESSTQAPLLPVEHVNGWYGLKVDPRKLAQARVAV